jgi:diguanylate cyclase (GGDEF)-like protein/PAS domain S-box-containing protein
MAHERHLTTGSGPTDLDPAADAAHSTAAVLIARLETLRSGLPIGSPPEKALREAVSALSGMQAEMMSAQQRLASLFDAVPDAVTVIDPDGRILDANAAACNVYGRSRDELCRMHVRDLNPTLPPDRMDQVKQTYRVGEIFLHETVNAHADGSLFPVDVHSAVFLDRGELRVLAVARDVSRRRAAEDELRASEARYRLLLQVMDKGVVTQDDRGRLIAANPAACRILAVEEGDLLGDAGTFRSWRVVDERGRPLALEDMPAMRALREGRTIESTLLGVYNQQKQRYIWLKVSAVPMFREGEEQPFQAISTFSDVTELKRDSELFAQTQALASIGGWEWDAVSNGLYTTEQFGRIVGLESGQPLTLDSFIALVLEPDRQRVRDVIENAQREAGEIDLEARIRRPDGVLRWLRLRGRSLQHISEVVRVSGTAQDITERKRREEELRRLALTDPLTGLSNRDAILEHLGRDIEQAAGRRELALLYVDLDRFKVVNDLLGHGAGDAMLATAARRLEVCIAGQGEVARFGADEFLVLVDDPQWVTGVEELAARITEAFARPFTMSGEEFSITVSVGVARYPGDAHTAHQLLNNADAAMYEAKRRGRNTWQMFTPALATQLSDRLLIEAHLRRALEFQEFRLVYQPQVDLRDGRLVGAEALLRWHNRQLGELSPTRFISHAENSGDIVRIGGWVIRESCRQLRAWRDEGLDISRISVNVSYRQFLSEFLAETVEATLREFSLPGECLELEVTERVLIEDAPDTFDTFAALKLLGVSITIDDFGEGYSALNYLRRLPIDGLKISHSFMQGVPGNPSDAAICQAIIGIARSLGLLVIAEGVEFENQRRFLLEHGARIAQGYMFSRPLTAKGLTDFARHYGIGLPPPP